MSLVVNALERSGIATVVVGTLRAPLQGLPRVLIAHHLRGLNFGEAGDTAEHERVAAAALELFAAAEPALRTLPSAAQAAG